MVLETLQEAQVDSNGDEWHFQIMILSGQKHLDAETRGHSTCRQCDFSVNVGAMGFR